MDIPSSSFNFKPNLFDLSFFFYFTEAIWVKVYRILIYRYFVKSLIVIKNIQERI